MPEDWKLNMFKASGDIRNLIRTVNCIPSDYEGRCDILFNDINPLVVGRNLVVLYALLNPDVPIEHAAELSIHLMYSSCITSDMSVFLSKAMEIVAGLSFLGESPIQTRGIGNLKFTSTVGETVNFKVILEMLGSRYSVRTAAQFYSKIMCSRERQDYTDRYISGFEPNHRLAFAHYRATGILAPFSLDLSLYNEPNR
ncbi:hypothetical protein H0H81_011755 [Sphagnurus paluster]|uniref:DUF4470 domain-containing protein n=1 Tax=Sphagnurus paluster TaxID=117069 RepID=A0A9P7K4Y8_9AGAR|nr:hypothetical protein H0H81_011755 [Sphagnurus paluster]